VRVPHINNSGVVATRWSVAHGRVGFGLGFQVFYNEERWKDAVPLYKDALKILKEKLGEKDDEYLRVRALSTVGPV
jgi:hypothetical protein